MAKHFLPKSYQKELPGPAGNQHIPSIHPIPSIPWNLGELPGKHLSRHPWLRLPSSWGLDVEMAAWGSLEKFRGSEMQSFRERVVLNCCNCNYVIAFNYTTVISLLSLSLYIYICYHISLLNYCITYHCYITIISRYYSLYASYTTFKKKTIRDSPSKKAISSGGSFRLLGSPRLRCRWTLELDTPADWVEHRRPFFPERWCIESVDLFNCKRHSHFRNNQEVWRQRTWIWDLLGRTARCGNSTFVQPRAFSLHLWWEPWLAWQSPICGRLMGCPLNQWIQKTKKIEHCWWMMLSL